MGWFEERFSDMHGRQQVACESCARSMYLPKSKVGLYRTCGGECAESLREVAKAARKRPCETCARIFTPRKYQIEHGTGRFCSQVCNPSVDLANAPEAKARARASWRRRFDASPFMPKGEQSTRWKGGRQATYIRQRESGKYRNANKRRAALLVSRVPDGTVQRLGDLQRWRCGICKTSIRHRFELDHVMPLALGGEHAPTNLQLLCRPCNRRKHAKHPVDYMQSLGFLL